jgi:hypothetical protein
MENIRIYTSFNFAYAARACLLAESLRKNEKNIEIIALLVDEIGMPGSEAALAVITKYFHRVVFAATLGIPNFRQWIFKHNVVEACTAVKPRMLEILLAERDGTVIYMDPDTLCFTPYVRQMLATYTGSIMLTPHQLTPNCNEQSIYDNELGSTKFGIFNLGFACVRPTTEGKSFAQWWRRSCEMACFEDVANGIFTDQKWCDLVPALFSDFNVIRDPGMNVASWNLSQRKIIFDEDGNPSIAGSTLKFFHFTKVGSVGNAMIARYADGNIEAFELLRWYTHALEEIALLFPVVKWFYGYFEDQTKISDDCRKLFRGRKDLMTTFKNPFSGDIDSYKCWCEDRDQLM